MAASGRSSGLTIGQLLSLTVGFLAASVVIFFFGLWVGRDLAEQRRSEETEIIRIPVSSPTPAPTGTATLLAETPTAGFHLVVATPTPFALRFVPTPTRAPVSPTVRAPTRGATSTPARAAAAEWTVQASATTDPVQAVVLARRLRARGYDAYTVQGPIAGVTWYRTQVGKFADRAAASAVEARLRREEKLEAAFVTRLGR